MVPLQADPVPFISDPAVSMLLVKLVAVAPSAAPRPGWEAGKVTFRVQEVFHSPAVKVNDSLVVPFERLLNPLDRLKSGADLWNKLSLNRNDLLILACKPLARDNAYEALAAVTLGSAQDPAVAEMRLCYQLEKHKGPAEKKLALFEEAFSKPHEPITTLKGFLRRYVLDALDRRHVLPREMGLEVIATALKATHTSADEKIEVATLFQGSFFFDERKGNDAVNRRVVALLAGGLVGDDDPERKARWVGDLVNCLLRDFAGNPQRNREIRLSLIRSLDPAISSKIPPILADQAAGEEEEDKKITLELLDDWKAARSAAKP